mmetsp:Transcript_2065/g.3648  ORF Transcript_2065/g.3648 Transcript_2065/m.3648 type:complete len:140 (-) Transcript_2065:183-602(-)|eukprot:CAMPEP_0168617478 /NCGR_PEP_ID=MMETSP0449_2-20121227/5563_1 /TAXON_ID=1082188 /ORGANISM="Strombidium rassoulzadegani, Strain ras09" /LENGTH=139 /DNA_ID=CAMNT_0008658295 /DNA_START=207 /DNA_END=626 /DNA_ORIENTATION=+
MGRALAVSKVQIIKQSVNNLSVSFKQEADAITNSVDMMLKKHQPTEIDTVLVDGLEKRVNDVIAQIPKINQLEKNLEIQEEDAELNVLKNNMLKAVSNLRTYVKTGNQKIRDKVGSIPDAAKVLTERQYQDEMSFVLRH